MFDRNSVTNNFSPEKIEVIHKKAPTDESVRLLSEMEEKILNKIVFSKSIANNCFDGEWYVIPPGMEDNLTIIGHLKFNGTPIKLVIEFNNRELRDGVGSIANKIKSRVSEEIANLVIRDMLSDKDLAKTLIDVVRK